MPGIRRLSQTGFPRHPRPQLLIQWSQSIATGWFYATETAVKGSLCRVGGRDDLARLREYHAWSPV